MRKQRSQHLEDRVRKFGIHCTIAELFKRDINLDSLTFLSVLFEQASGLLSTVIMTTPLKIVKLLPFEAENKLVEASCWKL